MPCFQSRLQIVQHRFHQRAVKGMARLKPLDPHALRSELFRQRLDFLSRTAHHLVRPVVRCHCQPRTLVLHCPRHAPGRREDRRHRAGPGALGSEAAPSAPLAPPRSAARPPGSTPPPRELPPARRRCAPEPAGCTPTLSHSAARAHSSAYSAGWVQAVSSSEPAARRGRTSHRAATPPAGPV